MERNHIIDAFSKLGEVLKAVTLGEQRPECIVASDYDDLLNLIEREQHYNGWFTKESIHAAFKEIYPLLTYESLIHWTGNYTYAKTPKTIALILPGNLPLVGFHDFLCVLISGHKALIKLSSEDARILPELAKILQKIEPKLEDRMVFMDGKLKNFDAVIATGSDNSMLHFKQYFASYPSIMRGHRTSVAVLRGVESQLDLELLGRDIFQYFGRGCRNVTHLLLSADFDLNRFFEAIVPYAEVISHKKYANNYDYNKAIHLMNQVPILDNNFLLLKESKDLNAPLAMIHYTRFESDRDIHEFIDSHSQQIQCIVGNGYLPFGGAQCPKLDDYADNINTMQFLNNFDACLS